MTGFQRTLPRIDRGPERSVAGSTGRYRPLRPYEVMVILDPGLEEDGIRATVDRATELIRSRGGNPGRVDRWGKRRFAYELKHRWEGYYFVLEAQAEPAVMADLDRMLSLADDVLRHKVIRLPDEVAGRARPAAAPAAEETAPEAAPSENGATEQ